MVTLACQGKRVTEFDPRGAASNVRAGRWPRAVAMCGAVGAAVGCVLAIVYLVHRSPCPPNYVRLIDLGVVVLVLQGLLLLAELVVGLTARSPGRHRVAGAFAVIFVLGVVVLLLPALSLALSTVESGRFDTGCWAF